MPRAAAPAQNLPNTGPAEKRKKARFEVFLQARCRVQEPGGAPVELEGRTRNVGEGGLLLLLPRALPRGVNVAVELDTQTGPAARSGQVAWVGPQETTELGKRVVPHGIAFRQPLGRAYVEALVTRQASRDPRAPVEVRVDYETLVSGRSVNLSRTGLFIRTAHPLPVDQTLTLRFALPGVPEPFQVQGQVIWSNPKAEETFPQGMGVRFLELPGNQAEQLGAFVAQVRRERGLERVTDLLGRLQEGEG